MIISPSRSGQSPGERKKKMTAKELKHGMEVWCWWMHRYLWYNGKACNGKDYEFVDAGDCVIVLNKDQAEKLEIK